MKRYSLIVIAAVSLGGCLTTRADLRADQAEDASRTPQQVTPAPDAPVLAANTAAPQDVAPPGRPAPPPSPGSRMDEYDEEFRQLTGRVEVLENGAAQAQTTQTADKQTLATDKVKLDERFAAYEEALKKLEAQMQALTDDVAKLKTPPPVLPAPAKGRADFDEGEALFGQKKWKESIVAYQQYRDANPKGVKYSDATYKIGVAFQELGLKDESKSFYEEVVLKFSKTPEAKKAKQRLKSLK